MSDSMTEVVTTNESGVVVEKSFEGDEFAVPAIKFVIRCERDERATLRLADDIPEEFPMDNVGFHPDYENDNWTAYKDHRVEFERELEPGEELVTVYGVRLADGDDPSTFLGTPSIEESRPARPTPVRPLRKRQTNPNRTHNPRRTRVARTSTAKSAARTETPSRTSSPKRTANSSAT
ncbi:hypothetical protein [Halorussus caseinilyticus]|uniref:Uncharacterized protein n=1 Tax=Halorussus caseinilyticus TaxID=3034025 RepID=A0ABD5WQX6_9EURY